MNAMRDHPRPSPTPMSFTRPYWDATRDKKLLLQYCPDSGRYQFYPRPVSLATGKRNLEWREVTGAGEVYSFTITRRAPDPFKEAAPYVVAMVQLPEGVRLMSNVVNCGVDAVHIGMRVVPHWVPLEDGRHLLMFQPA